MKLKRKITLILLSIIGLWFYFSLPSPLFKNPYSTVLLDKNNHLLGAKIAIDGQWRFRSEDTLSLKFTKCITHFEDEFFFYHPGINPISIFKALITNIKDNKIKRGGSTLSMQVARLANNNNKRTVFQKLKEAFLALRIECSYSKKEILEIYATHAPFGGNVVGIEAASWRYFNRPTSNLSWAENACLAVLPNSPKLIHPGKNRQLLLNKRNRLLQKLYNNKVIDSITFKLSLLEPIPEKPYHLPNKTYHLLNKIDKQLPLKKIIKTTIDKKLQTQLNNIILENVLLLQSNQINNIAGIIINNETQEVEAYIGNTTNNYNHSNWVNIIDSKRSSGSILKPFLHAGMINDGLITPQQILPDIPIQIAGYSPKNFDKLFRGSIKADIALAKSLNIPAVKNLQIYSVPKFHHILNKYGFTTINKSPSHYGLSLILGGAEISLFEISQAYSFMAQQLQFDSIKKIIYLKNKTKQTIQPKLSDASVYFTSQALLLPERPDEEDGWKNFYAKGNISWKTGTSIGFRDAWAVGFTPKYTVGIWVGNADGEGRPGLTGVQTAAPIMFQVFSVLNDKSVFKEPTHLLKKYKICDKSGMKVNDYCTNYTIENWPKETEQTSKCTYHKKYYLDNSKKFVVNKSCYTGVTYDTVFFKLPPLEEYFFKKYNIDYHTIPKTATYCKQTTLVIMDFIYPRETSKIFIPKDITGKKTACIFELTHIYNDATIFWYLGDEYLGKTENEHKISVFPKSGNNRLLAIDQYGNEIFKNIKFINN